MANRVSLCQRPPTLTLVASSAGPLRSDPRRSARRKDVGTPPRPRNGHALRAERAKRSVVRNASDRNASDESSPSDVGDKKSPSFPSDGDGDGVEGVLKSFAANAAAAEEAALAAAFANVSASTTSSDNSAVAPPPPAAAPPSSSSSSSPAPSPALAAKIAAARAYKAAAAERAAAGAGATTSGSGSVAPPPPPVVASPPPPPAFTRSTPPPPPPEPFAAASEDVAAASAPAAAAPAGKTGGEGSATEAAAFLRGVLSDDEKGDSGPPLDPDMRPEEFTALKQARERARGAEVITVDSAPSSSSGEYSPRVSTWGVYPRPQNISKAFGGGRTIRPGEPLETEEEKNARVARQKAALEAYRKKVGLVVDPRDEVEATKLVDAGNELMKRGFLEEAASEYEKAADLLPARSAVGGRARLQRAICLDSLGRSDEAFALYKSVQGHPKESIGKEAKRMLFGFAAMENLKAHTMSYAATKKEYEPFFGKLKSEYADFSGVPPSEEDERGFLFAVVAAVAVVAAPLVLFGALALNK